MVALGRGMLDDPRWGWHAARRSAPRWRGRRNICAPLRSFGRRRSGSAPDGLDLRCAISPSTPSGCGARSWRPPPSAAPQKGGICRLTLTDLDRQVRDWFKARAEKLGCRVTVDDMGAMFARRDGTADVPPIAMRQPSRHPADRRQVRRRARRAGGARGAAHPGRGRLRDLRADRGGELDQRGGLALCAGDGVVRRVRQGVRERLGAAAHGPRRHDVRRGARRHRLSRAGTLRRASAVGVLRTAHRAGADPGGRRARTSASSPACRRCAGTR